ncbi:MAG: alpha/beta fold hydrolase [Acidimicrobiia bacterium]
MNASIARRDWPGSTSEHVLLAHATGFCKEVWDPVVAELRALGWGGSITAWDAPGHGGSPGLAEPFDWWDTARATLDVIAASEPAGPKLGVGHSMGGASLVMAELLAPGTMRGLILIEPITFPPPFQRVEENPLAVGATRRRASFASRKDALDNFAAKAAFARWDKRALQAYVDGGLVKRDGRFWLACDPHVEADAYRSGTDHGAYARLPEIACPVLILAGAASESHPDAFVEHLADLVQDGRYLIIPGTGHFLPMERPDLIAGQVAGEFSRLAAD